MPKLRTLSAKKVVSILEKFGFSVCGQKGSHIKLAREVSLGRQILTIPNHKEMDKGTLKGIFNQVMRFVSESELREYFYAE